jgi:hypothetical protein
MTGPPITIATVDAAHAEVVREALEGAGLTVEVLRLSPFRQLDHLRHQRRQLADIRVPAAEEARARAALELLAIEAPEAAIAQAGARGGPSSDDDLRLDEEAERRRGGPLSSGVGLVLALVVPVAGPIYAGARRLIVVSAVAHAAGFLIYLLSSAQRFYRDDLHLQLGLVVLAAARFLDVVGTVAAIAAENARRSRVGPAATGDDGEVAPGWRDER